MTDPAAPGLGLHPLDLQAPPKTPHTDTMRCTVTSGTAVDIRAHRQGRQLIAAVCRSELRPCRPIPG